MVAHEPLFGDARLLLRLGLALWLYAALTAVWELLALQPPNSPLHAGVLAGPIAQTSTFAFAHGTTLVLLALLWPRLAARSWTCWALAIGATVHVAALTYAASKGLLAVQLLDPREDARWVLYVRAVAHTATVTGLVAILMRALRG